jgi:hypothetical protein
MIKGMLFCIVPGPFLVLPGEVMEWLCYIGKPPNESSVEVAESDEFLDSSDIAGILPDAN